MTEKRFAESFYNPITWIGTWLAIFVLVVECVLFALDFLSDRASPYLGLLTYLVLPPILLFGLLLIPIGAIRRKNRLKKGLDVFELRTFKIDLTRASHRNAILVFIAGSAFVFLLTLVASVKVFHYSESVKFCGLTCHSVMRPEYTAYLHSPHGQVKCVECHVGSGAKNYVDAKMGGIRQVFEVIKGTYDRPIKTPVETLHPATETCMECHWPDRQFGTKDFNRTYFLAEQENQPWKIHLSLHLGSIHSRMSHDTDIYFAAEDDRRQKITWVKSVEKAGGAETIYTTKKSKFRDNPPAAEEMRKMDCTDCHNRPTHQFRSPLEIVNTSMAANTIDPSLPDIKAQSLALLSKEYATTDEALRSIPEELMNYYKKNNPTIFESSAAKIDAAGKTLQKEFAANFFPEMKARWDAFPDNIGHMYFNGCFRCHDNKHEAGNGKIIGNNCSTCHTIIEQGPAGKLESNMNGLEFKHPDGEEDWKTTPCTKCHTGGSD
jgi:hypothetical protein